VEAGSAVTTYAFYNIFPRCSNWIFRVPEIALTISTFLDLVSLFLCPSFILLFSYPSRFTLGIIFWGPAITMCCLLFSSRCHTPWLKLDFLSSGDHPHAAEHIMQLPSHYLSVVSLVLLPTPFKFDFSRSGNHPHAVEYLFCESPNRFFHCFILIHPFRFTLSPSPFKLDFFEFQGSLSP